MCKSNTQGLTWHIDICNHACLESVHWNELESYNMRFNIICIIYYILYVCYIWFDIYIQGRDTSYIQDMNLWCFIQTKTCNCLQGWTDAALCLVEFHGMDALQYIPRNMHTVFALLCFAVLCCGYTLADFPISIRLTSLALWQSNDCPSASKATLMNMDKYFMWIHYERLHNHNKAKHNKTVCIFFGIYCSFKLSNTLMKIHEIYSARYIQLTHFLYDDCENMCTLPHYHPYVCHCELTFVPSDDLWIITLTSGW